MTLEDESFDLVISQDVFEHLFNPELAFAEVARTLELGGAHLYDAVSQKVKPFCTLRYP